MKTRHGTLYCPIMKLMMWGFFSKINQMLVSSNLVNKSIPFLLTPNTFGNYPVRVTNLCSLVDAIVDNHRLLRLPTVQLCSRKCWLPSQMHDEKKYMFSLRCSKCTIFLIICFSVKRICTGFNKTAKSTSYCTLSDNEFSGVGT